MTSLVDLDSFPCFIFFPKSFKWNLTQFCKKGGNGTRKRIGKAILDQNGEWDWFFRSGKYSSFNRNIPVKCV